MTSLKDTEFVHNIARNIFCLPKLLVFVNIGTSSCHPKQPAVLALRLAPPGPSGGIY